MVPSRSVCAVVVIMSCYVLCGFIVKAVPTKEGRSDLSQGYNEVSEMGLTDNKLAFLEKKLREEIERDLADLLVMEHQHRHNLNLIQEKKRQLEIKKREPVQCLVNIVSCWKRK